MLRPIYYDTETTGVKPGKDRVVELAAFDPVQNKTFCTFINPEMPIPAEATAVSKITDEDVKGAPLIFDALTQFTEFCSGNVVLIAHNNDTFDKLFLTSEYQRASLAMPDWQYIDSLKWSRKYRSDLPRHALQFLREAYGIESNQAHRALDDVMVLYKIFSTMIGDLSIETVLELMKQNAAIVRMPFGKYSGKPLSEVPKDYVQWMAKNGAFEKKENATLKETFEKMGVLT